jgi:anti-anti-sigma factor
MGTPGMFEVSVTGSDPAVVKLRGELDLAGVPQLGAALARLQGDVELHCSALDFIDAAGVGAFVAARTACGARGASLVLVDPSPTVRRVLSLVDLDTVLEMRRADEAS